MKTKFLKYRFVLGITIVIISGLIIWREYLSLEPEDVSFAWSFDGRQLAFACRRRQRDREWKFLQDYLGPYSGQDTLNWYELCTWDIESGDKVWLTRNAQYDGEPTWSPSGKHIAYISRSPGQYSQALMILTLGSSISTDLVVSNTLIGSPLWSPKRNQLAFVLSCDNTDRDLYLLDVDTKDTSRLTYRHSVGEFAWSSDGKHIAFVSGDYMEEEIFIISMETMNVSQITFDEGYKATPVWSPNDHSIVFTAGEQAQVYIIDVQTRETIRISTDTTSSHQFPTWSPNGDFLAFIRTSYGNERGKHLEIKRLDQSLEEYSYEITTCTVLDLQWSPSGQYLALNQCADWNRDGWNEFKIWLFDIEQGVLKPLYTTFPW